MIFPKPQNQALTEGAYQLRNSYHKDLLCFYNEIKNGNSDVTIEKNALLEKEEYHLSVTEEGITLTASCDEGLYRAATSLFQLIGRSDGLLPCIKVVDKPQFPRRGYMLDISRCRMRKPETLRKLIDFLSELKYNEFQLYMEADCFKYSAYPKYTEDFDCLTPEDIKELNEYCRERFIDLVPNQNSFGHLGQWLSREEFKELEIADGANGTGTINPLLPESFEFISNLYESLLPYFDSEYINIGLDEAGGLGRFQVEEYCAKHGRDTLFMEWLNKLSTLAREKYGKKVMFWGDMIYKWAKLYEKIPQDAVIMEWGYELIQSQVMTEHCIAFEKTGLDYYVCPSCNTHMSFTGRADVTSFNIRTSAEIGAKYGAKGILLTDWGCGEGHPHFDVWSYVPAALCGQYGWNIGAEQDGETFKADFIRNSEKFVDEKFFGGKPVSRLLYRVANYYLLEPERVHLGSMCGLLFRFPITETKYYYLFDLKDSGDAFYFNNVTEYIEKILRDIRALEFDAQLKSEIILNCEMVILASELCKIRLGINPSADEITKLLGMIDAIAPEYRRLWCERNYEKGVGHFEAQLELHKNELLNMM